MNEPTVTITEAGPVNADDAPSTKLVNAAKSEVTITDPKGRRIVLKSPGVLGQFRLIEMLGQTASNQVYVNMVLPLIYVASVDSDPAAFNTKRELEALIQRLEEDGISAVMEAVNTHFRKADPDADKEAVKN